MRILLVTLYLVYIYAHFNTLAERFFRFSTFLSSWNQFSNYVLVINFRWTISEKKKTKVVFEYKSESSNDLDFKISFIEFFNTFLFFALSYHTEQQKFYYIIISQNNILSSIWLNLFVRLFWLLGWLWKWWRNWFTRSVSTMQLQSELMQRLKLCWNLWTLKWLRFLRRQNRSSRSLRLKRLKLELEISQPKKFHKWTHAVNCSVCWWHIGEKKFRGARSSIKSFNWFLTELNWIKSNIY